jgi:hypothetical protein
MPLTFEALKSQRFRWCFGGVQILRKHWRSLLPWDRSPDNHLTLRQRYDYFAGGVQWFGDLVAVAFAALLVAGSLNLVLGSGLVFRRLSGALLVIPPVLLVLGLVRAVGLIRRRTGAGLVDAVGALTMWLALGLTVAKACVQGVVHRDGVFLRTPKTKGDATWGQAVRANLTETVVGVVVLAIVPAVALSAPGATTATLAVLLAWHAAALLLAPVQSIAALNADLSPELRQLRRSEWFRERLATNVRPFVIGSAAAGAIAATVTLVVVLLAPAPPAPGPVPDIFAESRGRSGRTTSTTVPTSAPPGTTAPAGPGVEPSTPTSVPPPSGSTTTARAGAGPTTSAAGSASSTAPATTSTTRPGGPGGAHGPTTTVASTTTPTRSTGPPTAAPTTGATSATAPSATRPTPPVSPTTRPHP